MFRVALIASAVGGLLISILASAATPVHKCVVNGTATYQQDPCPSGQARKSPTTEQLNIEQKKRSEASGPDTGNRAEPRPELPSRAKPGTASDSSAGHLLISPTSPGSRADPPSQFRCDGRRYCSQMTSCAEAKYFLANCPDVKMDGDRNGIPCEKQWCNP